MVGHADRDVQPVLSALIPLYPSEAQARTTVIAGQPVFIRFTSSGNIRELFDPVATRVTENVCQAKQRRNGSLGPPLL